MRASTPSLRSLSRTISPEARRTVEACASAGVQLAVHQNFRYHYPFDLARSLVRAGRIGRVMTVLHRELLFRTDSGWRASTERHACSP